MSDPQAASVVLAEARAAAARRRLSASAATLQARLDPQILARDAVQNLTVKGETALRLGMQTAQANPRAMTWAAIAATAWIARGRIAAAFRRKRPNPRETELELARSIPGDWPQAAERNDI